MGKICRLVTRFISILLVTPALLVAQEYLPMQSEFHFTRLAFGVYGRIPTNYPGEPWLRDWPDAEDHFMEGLRRLTAINAGGEHRQVSLLDDTLFDYPVIYAVKVGYWELNPQEIGRMREYLARGGFLIVDDFHGPDEWARFQTALNQILPGHPVQELANDDEIFHVLYDLDDRRQIPGRQSVYNGVSWEHPQGMPEYWRALKDDDGRIMVAINFNMDMGDAWEHADDPFYPEPLTALAYRTGINYIIYSLTH